MGFTVKIDLNEFNRKMEEAKRTTSEFSNTLKIVPRESQNAAQSLTKLGNTAVTALKGFVPNRLTDKPLQLTVADEAGAQHTVYMRRHYNAQQPHISEDFVKLEQAYLDCGAARNTKFGDAACILCDAEGLFRVTRHVLAPNPEAFVTEPVIPAERWQALCTGKT